MSTKRVLLTGATGFIGRHALQPLVDRGYEVHAIAYPEPLPGPRAVHWHHADLLDASATSRLLDEVRPTDLLHLAWYAVPGQYWTSPENLRWLRASVDLLEAFARSGGRRLVSAGTCAEYDWSFGHCVERETPLAPATLYGTCKHALNLLTEAWARQAGLSAAWGRIFFLYGPHEHPDRLVSSVIRALLAAQPALCTEGTQIRDFLFVQDVADALVAVLDSGVEGPVNIASGTPVAVRDVILGIADEIGRPDLIRLGARSSNEVPRLTAATERLAREVGWTPRVDLRTGLAKTIAWWREQPPHA